MATAQSAPLAQNLQQADQKVSTDGTLQSAAAAPVTSMMSAAAAAVADSKNPPGDDYEEIREQVRDIMQNCQIRRALDFVLWFFAGPFCRVSFVPTFCVVTLYIRMIPIPSQVLGNSCFLIVLAFFTRVTSCEVGCNVCLLKSSSLFAVFRLFSLIVFINHLDAS